MRHALHRLVAIAAWGAAAVKGKEVGHKEGDTTRNTIADLWLPDTIREHRIHDIAKTEWEPCVLCGDPDGYVTYATPDRFTGRRFGIDGDICRRCYNRLKEREARRQGLRASKRAA